MSTARATLLFQGGSQAPTSETTARTARLCYSSVYKIGTQNERQLPRCDCTSLRDSLQTMQTRAEEKKEAVKVINAEEADDAGKSR